MSNLYIKIFSLAFLIGFLGCKNNVVNEPKPVLLSLKHQKQLPKNMESHPAPALIILHGLGSNDQNAMKWAGQLGKQWAVFTVQAPLRIGEDKYSWYPYQPSIDQKEKAARIMNGSLDLLAKFISEIQEAYNIDKDRIVIGGFSQGAIMSAIYSIENPGVVDGVAVLSGTFPERLKKESKEKPNLKGLKVFLSHGDQDQVLPIAAANELADYFKELNADVEAYWYGSGHTISSQNFTDLVGWLNGF